MFDGGELGNTVEAYSKEHEEWLLIGGGLGIVALALGLALLL